MKSLTWKHARGSIATIEVVLSAKEIRILRQAQKIAEEIRERLPHWNTQEPVTADAIDSDLDTRLANIEHGIADLLSSVIATDDLN